MTFDIITNLIALFSRDCFAYCYSDLLDSNNYQFEIAFRFILALSLVTIVFLIIVSLVVVLFVHKYWLVPKKTGSVVSPKPSNLKFSSREIERNNHSEASDFDESAIESDEISIRSNQNCYDRGCDSEELDILPFLNQRTFYKNLNNSSQYLRRDSFSQ